MESLRNTVAVVTGGTRGIGRAIAETLLEYGSSVFICGRDEAGVRRSVKELSEKGIVRGEICDVRNESEVKAMLELAAVEFGGIDILVNNAGIGIMGKTTEDISGDEFRRTIETNILGVFYACHYVLPMMKVRGGGYIINISSLAGQNAHPGMAAYNASKFGLNGFSEALMQEVRHDNIRVSYICPGSVNTEFGGDEISESKAWQLQPEDVAKTVLGLLSLNERALASKVELRPSRPPKR